MTRDEAIRRVASHPGMLDGRTSSEFVVDALVSLGLLHLDADQQQPSPDRAAMLEEYLAERGFKLAGKEEGRS